MTRVQKYHRYREEIANMKNDDFSEENNVKKSLETKNNTHLSYDQIIDAYGIDNKDNKPINKKLLIIFGIIALAIIAAVVLLIVLL